MTETVNQPPCEFNLGKSAGIDLSMGRVTVRNNRFMGCERQMRQRRRGRSRVSLRGNSFTECDIGIAVKDSAQALVEQCRFDSCRVGYSSYMKKWRWGVGGVGWLRETIVRRLARGRHRG